MLLIINADDLGRNPRVNETTLAMIASGAVTSATLMANAPHVAEAARAVPLFPECSFGIHLNLTEFRPLRPQPGLAPLIHECGSFRENAVRQVRLAPSLLQAIENEWAAQIDSLLARGIRISHVDSHHHVHTIPRLLPVLKRLQARYRLAGVRISRNIYAPHQKASKRLLFCKHLYNLLLRHYSFSARTTSGFTDLFTFHTTGRLRQPRHRSVEIMVHPGSPDYEAETALLASPWRADLPFPVDLISYHQL